MSVADVISVITGSTTAGSLVLIAWLVYKLVAAKDALADSRVSDQGNAGKLAIAESDRDTQAKRADSEKARADGLATLMDKVRAGIAGSGNYRDLVLSIWGQGANASGGDSASAVHPGSSAATTGSDPDALEKP